MSYSDLTEKQLQELVAKSIEVPVHSVQKVKFDLEQFEAIADAIVSATDTEDYDIDEE